MKMGHTTEKEPIQRYSTPRQGRMLVFCSSIPQPSMPWYPRCQIRLETHRRFGYIAHPQIICYIVVLKEGSESLIPRTAWHLSGTRGQNNIPK